MNVQLPTPGESFAGVRLANFRVDALIKRGGMAEVYYGWDVMLHRPVAIKIIDSRQQSNAMVAERFLREARSVANWRHENITQVYYADKQEGLYYFVMEYVDGMDLGDLLDQYQKDKELMPLTDALRIGRAIAKALDYAHAHAVIHRDVKPSNILLSLDERILLTDFGLAMIQSEGPLGDILGTPHYVAPEQALHSSEVIPQTDQYSLAVVMFELLTGRLPFVGKSVEALMKQHLSSQPPAPNDINPNLGEALSAVLLRGLHKNPERRYSSSSEFVRELEQVAQVEKPTSPAWLMMPPPPAEAQTEGGDAYPSLISRVSVVEKIAAHVAEQNPAGETATAPNHPASLAAREEKRPFGIWGLGVALLIIMSVAVFIIFWQGDSDPEQPVAAVLPTAMETAVPPSPTSPPTAVIAATLPPPDTTLEPTATAAPTETAVAPTATSTTQPTPPTPATDPDEPLTLQPLPNGNTLRFFYDETSFYILNPNSENISLSSLTLVGINKNQSPELTNIVFRGQEWANFFAWLTPTACVRIEIDEAEEWLRPNVCSRYNVSLVIQSFEQDKIFWQAENNITHFRLFWDGQPVGDCPVFTGICQLP